MQTGQRYSVTWSLSLHLVSPVEGRTTSQALNVIHDIGINASGIASPGPYRSLDGEKGRVRWFDVAWQETMRGGWR